MSYVRGTTFLKYLNVLRPNGTVPVFPTEYAIPTYSILFKNGVFSTVISDEPMIQGDNNVWYFSYSIPALADLGTYLIKYKLAINGVNAEITEDFIVVLESGIESIGPGLGDFTIIDVVESTSMVDLQGVDVYVFLPTNTNQAIAHATTDTNGQFTVHLDSGTYVVLFNKAGYISETHGLTVSALGVATFDGD